MSKIQNSKQIRILAYFICVFVFLFLVFDFSYAAVLYLSPETQTVHIGDTFIQEIRIETQESINAVEVYLTYPSDILEVVDVSFGNSILSVIAKEPNFSVIPCHESSNDLCGLVSFAGGIPGGYTGRIPGDPGITNILGKIIFQVRETNAEQMRGTSAKIIFHDDSKVLLNDGLGTPADLEMRGADIKISAGVSELAKDQWQEQVGKDSILPESFYPQISQDQSTFNGQYFLVFSALDKQTGIDYYEVAELRPIVEKREITQKWQRAKSPYLLTDQTLRSIIKVKAVDKAGNQRIEIIKPAKKQFPYWIVVLILIIAAIILWLVKRGTRRGTRRGTFKGIKI